MSNWALRNSQVHPSHRCECRVCHEQYNMHYHFEWQGEPPDVRATGLYTRGLRGVMETPPEYQRRSWATGKRYAKL